jgi:hypothetical protein
MNQSWRSQRDATLVLLLLLLILTLAVGQCIYR